MGCTEILRFRVGCNFNQSLIFKWHSLFEEDWLFLVKTAWTFHKFLKLAELNYHDFLKLSRYQNFNDLIEVYQAAYNVHTKFGGN